jgi:hypothetical protein
MDRKQGTGTRDLGLNPVPCINLIVRRCGVIICKDHLRWGGRALFCDILRIYTMRYERDEQKKNDLRRYQEETVE